MAHHHPNSESTVIPKSFKCVKRLQIKFKIQTAIGLLVPLLIIPQISMAFIRKVKFNLYMYMILLHFMKVIRRWDCTLRVIQFIWAWAFTSNITVW